MAPRYEFGFGMDYQKGNLLFEVDFPLPPAPPQLTETKYQDAD